MSGLTSTLLTLTRGRNGLLQVRPRWPASTVRIDPAALSLLEHAQRQLPPGVELVITRAYEEPGTATARCRRILRRIGMGVFWLFYPARRGEIGQIFSHNGHEWDGTHVDVSVSARGRIVNPLKLGVFTPLIWIRRMNSADHRVIARVKVALESVGFSVHGNAVESMQIHCDLPAGGRHPRFEERRNRARPA